LIAGSVFYKKNWIVQILEVKKAQHSATKQCLT